MSNKRAPSQLLPLWVMFKYALIAYTRSRAAMFFGFLFPLVFISVFGLIGEGGSSVTVGVAQENQRGPVYEAIKNISAIKVETNSESALESKLQQGRIAGVLTLDQDELNPVLKITQASPQQSGAVSGLVGALVDKVNLAMVGVKDPPVKLKIEEISGRKYRYIDFALPGIIGFALLGSALFGTAFNLVFLRKTLVMKRLFATPVKGSTVLIGIAGSRLVIAVAQTLVILGFGVLAFQFTLVNGWVTLVNALVLAILGLVTFMGFGIMFGGIAPNEDTLPAVTNLFTLPQFLLSGTFFPLDTLPSWVQPAANVLPLSIFNTAMRKLTVEGLSFIDILPYLAGLAIWSLLAYAAAAKTFKWD